MNKWIWKLEVKDFADGYWPEIESTDLEAVVAKMAFWTGEGHAIKLSSRKDFVD